MKHLLHVFPTFAVGGVSVRMTTILNQIGGGYRHTVIALDGCYDCRTRLGDHVDAQFLQLPLVSERWMKRFVRIHRVLRRIGADLLLTYNWGAIEWAMANRISRICPHLHLESGFGKEEAIALFRRRILVRQVVLPGARYVIVPSRTLLHIAENVWRLDRKKVVYIPNGVDCSKFTIRSDPPAVDGFHPKPGEVIIGTVAPLRPEKNLARLIRAFAHVARSVPARLLIVGDGPERPKLALVARDLGVSDRVVFSGQVAAVDNVLGMFDIFALSSDTEQMPNSVLQAMAAARPVVAPDVGDIKFNVSPANRPYIVPNGDESAFQHQLERLTIDFSLRTVIGQANREHVQLHYGEDRMVAAYREIIAAACNTSPLGPEPAKGGVT